MISHIVIRTSTLVWLKTLRFLIQSVRLILSRSKTNRQVLPTVSQISIANILLKILVKTENL